MSWLFIADPPEGLRPLGDSTLFLLRRALSEKIRCAWASAEDIGIAEGRLVVRKKEVLSCEKGRIPELLETAETVPVSSYRAVLIRKDPPFDSIYVRLCWLLQLVENKIYCLNPPSCLLRYHEKLVPLQAFAEGFLRSNDIVPTFYSAEDLAREYFKKKVSDWVVVKPFLGHGGGGVERHPPGELRIGDSIAQPFLPEIEKGDIRVFFLGGKRLAWFTRLPAPGDFVSNLAQGGRAHPVLLNKAQIAVLDRLGKFLKTKKIDLAGADLIGNKISEVNITSPTGLASLFELEGKDYSEAIVSFIRKRSIRRAG